MVNTGNKRREDTQALMIPRLRRPRASTSSPTTPTPTRVFQKRLPGAGLRPGHVHQRRPRRTRRSRRIMACDQIPSAENNNQGQNTTGWCNEEASTLMTESDQELDETTRIEQIHQIGQYLVDDARHAAAVPVPEHRRLADRQARRPGRRGRRQLPERLQEPQQVGAHGRRPRSPSAPSSGRTASTRSRSAPTRRGWCGRRRSRSSRRCGTPRRRRTDHRRW